METLILQAKEGNEEAFSEIYKYDRKRILYLCFKILGNLQDAEDATQEVFIKVKKNIVQLKAPSSYKVWINKIAMNVCMRMITRMVNHREKQKMYECDSLVKDDNYDFLPTDYVENEEKKQMILSIIDGLSYKYKSVILLYYYDEMTHSQIAEILSITKSAVDHILRRARNKIKEEVEKQIGEKSSKKKYNLLGISVPVLTNLFQQNEKEVLSKKVMLNFDANTMPILSNTAFKNSSNMFLGIQNVFNKTNKLIVMALTITGVFLGTWGIIIHATKENNSLPLNQSFSSSTVASKEQVPQPVFVDSTVDEDMNLNNNYQDSIAVIFQNKYGKRSSVNPVIGDIYISQVAENSIIWEIEEKQTGVVVKKGLGTTIEQEDLLLTHSAGVTPYLVKIKGTTLNGKQIFISQEIFIAS